MLILQKSQQKSLVDDEAENGESESDSSFTRANFLGRRLKNQALPNLQDRVSYFFYAKSGCSGTKRGR